MADGTARTPKQEQEPAPPGASEVAPGVVRLALPIQMTGLGHVNMYALLDDRGAAIVDPGMPGPISWRAVERRLREAGLKKSDIHTILITHSHPDHFGGAGQLAEESGGEVVVHAAFSRWGMPARHTHSDASVDSPTLDAPPSEAEEVDPAAMRARYRTAPPWGGSSPWSQSGARRGLPITRRVMLRVMGSRAMQRVFRFPTPTVWMEDGEVIKLAGREWRGVHTPGHTVDHLCLHDPEEGILLSGDHVLPTITPHISGLGGDEDPLRSYLDSLQKVADLEGVRRVLPAHGHPFDDLKARVAGIKHHHDERISKIREIAATSGPATVMAFSQQLFRKERWGGMAESETYAHLEHLRLMGEAERRDDGPAYIYEVAPAG